MALSHLLDIPRPRSFLHIMSLRTGAELITFLMLINKVSGFYGILALLTGHPLSALQFSMYLYSVVALGASLYLYPHIRRQSPFQCLALAHLYALDSVINALYTFFFGIAWFYVLASHPSDDANNAVPGAEGIDKSAGFTSPKHNVSSVEVVASPAGGLTSGQDAVAVGKPSDNAGAGLGNAVFQSGSIMSITMISGFWALKIYFVFIMLAFARQVLRQHIATTSSSAAWYSANTQDSTLAENPFSGDKEEGQGWKGKLGRVMLTGAPRYWLGSDQDGEWMRGVGRRFNRKNTVEPVGVVERERRRRAGTGPPAPPRELVGGPKKGDVPEAR